MAGTLVVTLDLETANALHAKFGETKMSERATAADLLNQAAQKIGAGSNDTVLVQSGTVVGSWVFSGTTLNAP